MQLGIDDFLKASNKHGRTKDLLNVREICDGYFIRKDGMPVFAWKIREGINLLNKEKEFVDGLIQDYSKLFENLGDGEVIQLITSSRPLDPDKILGHYRESVKLNDRVSQELIVPAQINWVNNLAKFSTTVDISHYVLFSLYKKPLKLRPEDLLEALRQKSISIVSYLQNAQLHLSALNAYEIKNLMDREINPFQSNLSDQAMNMAAPVNSDGQSGFSSVTDALARDAIVTKKDLLELGEGFVRTMYLKTLPFDNYVWNEQNQKHEYSSNIFAPAIFYNCGYFRISVFAYGIDQETAKADFKRQNRDFQQLSENDKTGFKRQDNAETEVALARTNSTLMRAANGLLHYNKFNFIVSLYADSLDELNESTNRFKSIFTDFHLKAGYYEQDRLFSSSLPFCYEVDQDRASEISADGLANSFSFLSAKTGTSTGSLEGFDQFREPVFFDPWLRKGEIENGITVKFGMPGSGKSFSEEKEILQMYPQDIVYCIFHKSSSYNYSSHVLGAQIIRFGVSGKTKINIMEPANPDEIASGSASVDTIFTVLGALEIMLFDGERMDMLCKSLLEDAIRMTYERNKGKIPLLEDLAKILEKMADDQKVKEHALILRNLRVKLGLFIGRGSYAEMMNQPSNVKINSKRIVVDLSDLGNDTMLFNLAMYLCAKIAYTVKYIAESQGITRALIKFDETWAFIASPYGQTLIANLARTQRHLNVAVYLSTQFVSDLDATETVKAFLRAAQNKVIFKQPQKDRQLLAETFQLSGKELDLIFSISGSVEYKQAYIITGERRGLVNVMTNRHFYWIITSENDKEVPLRKQITERYTDEHGNIDYVAAVNELVRLEKR
jgi:hypothetical protein